MASTKQESNFDQNLIAIVSALIRALSHKIRTPLSVISNDLSYLKTLLPNEDIDRDLSKVKLISELLRDCTESLSIKEKESIISPEQLLRSLTDSGWNISTPESLPFSLNIRLKTFLTTLNLIAKLQDEINPNLKNQESSKTTLSYKNNPQSFGLELHAQALNDFNKNNGINNFHGFSALFCDTLQLDLPYAPLIDLLLSSQNIMGVITTSTPTKIELTIQKS